MVPEPSLTSLLDHYAELVVTLPVPEPSPTRSDRYLAARSWILNHGERVTDRLLPGATTEEIDHVESRLGWRLPSPVREWFRWRHGHAGGLGDEDDQVACLFPFGRQLDLDAAPALLDDLDPLIYEPKLVGPRRVFLVLEGRSRYFLVDCEDDENGGAVWFFDPEFECRIVFDSLPMMVENAIDLFNRRWLELNDFGAVELKPIDQLKAEGVTFAPRLEEARLREYGQIPSSAQ